MRITTYFFKLLLSLQNYANNFLDRGSQFNTGEAKLIEKLKYVDRGDYAIPVRETDVTKKADNLQNIKVAKLRKVKLFWLEYVKISASMVMAKESNILKSLAFPKFFLCVLNRSDKNNEQKQANKKQRKANKQKKFK